MVASTFSLVKKNAFITDLVILLYWKIVFPRVQSSKID